MGCKPAGGLLVIIRGNLPENEGHMEEVRAEMGERKETKRL